MTNKEIEDAITKALLNGEGRLVPIDELGGNEEDYDYSSMNDEIYALYVDSCHLKDSLDSQQTSEKIINRTDEDSFAIIGRIGFYQWYALSAYYDNSIHKMTKEKEESNDHHLSSAADEFEDGPGEHISKAINSCYSLVNLLRNPIVVNCSDMNQSLNLNQNEMETHLRHFLGINIFPEPNVIERDGQNIKINIEAIRGKDVIIPLLYASNANLKVFGHLAQKISLLGANTVIGIFATRIVPTIDGKEGRISQDMQVASFSPRFRINF